MAKKIIWSDEQIDDIVSRYLRQETTREIAKVYKCSKITISKLLKKNDIQLISRRTLNKKPSRKPRKIIDKTGNIYGKLTVIKEGPRSKDKLCKAGRQMYWCECSCGLSCVLIDKRKLREGGTQSCGLCLERDEKGRFPQKVIFKEEDKKFIITSYKKGKSIHDLAKDFKCSVRPIRDIVVNAIGKGTKNDLRTFSDKEALSMKKEFDANQTMTYVKLQRKYGGTTDSIRSALFRVGISGRGSGFLSTYNAQMDMDLCKEIWHKYNSEKISAEELGKQYEFTEGMILKAIRLSGNEPRNPWDTQFAFDTEEEKEIIKLYNLGRTATEISKDFGVTANTVLRSLRRHEIEIRNDNDLENMQMILNKEGRYAIKRETNYYVYSLKGLPEYLKPGIKFKDEDRAKHSEGYYDQCLLLDLYSCREEAYFVEQAVLNETSSFFDCPKELEPNLSRESWAGWTELRRISFNQLEKIINFYRNEILEMGKWFFAVDYVPMTQKQKEECLLRARNSA